MARHVLAWLPMLGLAIADGALCQAVLAPAMPELRAHRLPTLTGSLLIGAFIWLATGRWPPSSSRQALGIGVAWLAPTVAFELFVGLALAPWLFHRLRTAR